ncbi:hypothetical protein N656DRAFT_797981 [Canariomyces notabilis]|uniref:Zn(2)-C6 fungal-type domain-containing protein n=1 Tax=Canariomyces notabilis TaxID=2074819 RepID=A0AAN6TE89_9PEZI|nr:hypothetical protein N656DRAFT_797981 [Canariomyces arenarius]
MTSSDKHNETSNKGKASAIVRRGDEEIVENMVNGTNHSNSESSSRLNGRPLMSWEKYYLDGTYTLHRPGETAATAVGEPGRRAPLAQMLDEELANGYLQAGYRLDLVANFWIEEAQMGEENLALAAKALEKIRAVQAARTLADLVSSDGGGGNVASARWARALADKAVEALGVVVADLTAAATASNVAVASATTARPGSAATAAKATSTGKAVASGTPTKAKSATTAAAPAPAPAGSPASAPAAAPAPASRGPAVQSGRVTKPAPKKKGGKPGACAGCKKAKAKCERVYSCERCFKDGVDCSLSTAQGADMANKSNKSKGKTLPACERCRTKKAGCSRVESCKRCMAKKIQCAEAH